MKVFFKVTCLFLLTVLLYCSCNKGEIDDLEDQIRGLENQGYGHTVLADITAKSQSAIDFLGEEEIKVIKGIFTISGYDITDLSPLDSLKEVGSLIIEDNPRLKSLKGIDGLNHINNELRIAYNDSLQYLTGLEGLLSVKGQVYINSNDDLENFCGIKEIWKNEVISPIIFGNKEDPASWEELTDCD